jgi:hypothetical protein
MTRAKVAGVRRNTAVALGNAGGSASRLDAAGEDRASVESDGVQTHVRWARARLL